MVLTVNLAYYLLEQLRPGRLRGRHRPGRQLRDSPRARCTIPTARSCTSVTTPTASTSTATSTSRRAPIRSWSARTSIFQDYMNANHFVISINYHGGALVVNYPWDYTYTLAPDDRALHPAVPGVLHAQPAHVQRRLRPGHHQRRRLVRDHRLACRTGPTTRPTAST